MSYVFVRGLRGKAPCDDSGHLLGFQDVGALYRSPFGSHKQCTLPYHKAICPFAPHNLRISSILEQEKKRKKTEKERRKKCHKNI
jgi:hypothetical protein